MIYIIGLFLIGCTLVRVGISSLVSNESNNIENTDYIDFQQDFGHENVKFQNRSFQDYIFEEQIRVNDQYMQQFMEESMKSVTPFEHGGYDMNQGNSFNNFNNGMF